MSKKVQQNFDGRVTPQDGLCFFFEDLFIRALKLAANHEKQVPTFFAFLPPYMAVSGSAVPRKR